MSAPAVAEPLVYSIGALAEHFGVSTWQARRVFQRKLVAEPGRVGCGRAVPAAQLPEVERALRTCGYLPAE